MSRHDDRTAVVDVSAIHAARATVRDRVLLVRIQGGQLGLVFALSDEAYRVGRAPDAELLLFDAGISRQHARLVRRGDVYAVEDLGSAYGTYVNGESATERMLVDGDIVQFGPSAVFRYELADADQEAMLRDLYEASIKDSLTGAYNHEYFEARLETELSYARRHQTELGLLMMDIDHFKRVNDTYGHQVGDFVLVELTSAVSSHMRAEDVFARYGGEEFAVILRDTDVKIAHGVGERFRRIIESFRVEYNGQVIPVTVSIGAASLASCTEKTLAALVAAADRNLYVAKRGGRNRVVSDP